MICESVFGRMIRKYGRPYGEPKVKEEEKQKDDEAVMRDWWKQVETEQWSRSLWENVQKNRQQFGNWPQDDDQSNRPQLRKRKQKLNKK